MMAGGVVHIVSLQFGKVVANQVAQELVIYRRRVVEQLVQRQPSSAWNGSLRRCGCAQRHAFQPYVAWRQEMPQPPLQFRHALANEGA